MEYKENELKQGINLPHLQEAAMFHDYGKVLIPEKILNKAGKLNENEQEIIVADILYNNKRGYY